MVSTKTDPAESPGRGKLTPAQVEGIKTRWQGDPTLSKLGLGKQYGVSDTYIGLLVKGLPKAKQPPAPKQDTAGEKKTPAGAGGDDGKKEEKPGPFGTNVSHRKSIEVPIAVDFYYEDALRRGFAGDEGEFIAQIVIAFFEYRGLTLGVVRKANVRPSN